MLKHSIKLMSLLMLAGLVLFTSCDKEDDDDDNPPVIVLDGLYINGAATPLSGLDSKGMLAVTRNEVTQEDRTSLFEIYMALKGNEEFHITQVEGSSQTVWGPGGDFGEVAEPDGEEPQVTFWRGSLIQTGTGFTVPSDGLYHVALDTELGIVVVVPVEYWGLIGAATPGGWSDDTKLMPGGFDMNSMTFSLEGVEMTKADYKFRYSGGWKVFIDGEVDLGGGVIGVKVNSNYGEALDNLVPGGANITNTESGVYTAEMTWTLGEGYAATMTRTGDLEVVDYTDVELGLVGDGLVVNGAQHNWDETVMLHTPAVENENEYTWTFSSVEITTAGSFKIRQGQDWSGYSFGFNDVTMLGLAADKFETNDDGNFVPLEDGVFDIEFFINAVTDEYTFTVNPAGQTVEMYMLGDGCSAGWDNTAALPMEGSDGVYTLTTELFDDGTEGIKFITVLGQWQPQYGTDETGTTTGGPLFVNDGTGSDPQAVPCPPNGTYTVTVNTNDMTYTIEAK